ncbi:trichohyalin-like [Drosophila rhopaloa]|uniref:Trichohyalin n=1 Tax=Drosophila rhopaloa TaxID=1041015 RepID=A0ABM5J3U7_DRORH|nr:trichohyalin-like [Drosophila rhopaloa]
MDSQNRLDASQRQSQRNMDARAQLSEDELARERGQQRNRIRSSARDLYHRNIKEGPTAICICCGGTWFRSQLEGICLADFAAWYRFVKRIARSAANHREDYDEANDVEVDDEDEVAEQSYPLMDGSGCVKKRRHPLILRWVRFSINSSPCDYFREHLMLFYPWRNEEAELLSNDIENTFRVNHEAIKIMKRNYDVFDDMELERVLEDLQEDRGDNAPDAEEPASQFLDEEFRALAVPNIERNYRNPERVRDAAARTIRREDTEERRQEQVQNTADHATRRNNPEFRISERIRDAAARAAHREDPEERAREQERNTGEHRQRRRDMEDRQRERERDADNRRATRRNPIARSQEQRINTSQRRETRQQRRIREEQIRQMAEDRLLNFRMDSQNRLDASQRQSQRNMDARAQLSEDELARERGQQRNRIRSSARDLYHRNIKEGPTAICICCGGTWFRSQLEGICLADFAAWYRFVKRIARSAANHREDYDEANDVEVDDEDEVAEQSYPLMDGSGCVKKRRHPLILRWVRFSINSSPCDYFREHLMLFYPWRNEEAELLSNDIENTFRVNHEAIKIMKRNYDVFDDMELERVLEDLQEDRGDNAPDAEEPASQFLDEEFRALAVPNIERNYRNPERVRDAAARTIRREDTEERRQEQVQNTADHATRRNNPEFRISERIRDAAARAAHREDPEERAREQERNTGEHRQRRRDMEDRQRERERDADNRRATRRNPIARSQEQRINTSQRRETRQQRRIREEQIRQMAEDRLLNFRMDSQNRLDASQRQSQRNMDARAQLSEDELARERGQQRNRIRSSARDLYHRNIKEGPTAICICCGGTWFRSQNFKELMIFLLLRTNLIAKQ